VAWPTVCIGQDQPVGADDRPRTRPLGMAFASRAMICTLARFARSRLAALSVFSCVLRPQQHGRGDPGAHHRHHRSGSGPAHDRFRRRLPTIAFCAEATSATGTSVS